MIENRKHDMPFIVRVIVVIGINNSLPIDKGQLFFDGQPGADMNA